MHGRTAITAVNVLLVTTLAAGAGQLLTIAAKLIANLAMHGRTAITAVNVLLVTTLAAGAGQLLTIAAKLIANLAMHGRTAITAVNVLLVTTLAAGAGQPLTTMDRPIVNRATLRQVKIIHSQCRNVQIAIIPVIGATQTMIKEWIIDN